jgi:hypothetical protein
MSGFSLIDDRDPTTDEVIWWLGERGDMTLSNYMWKDGDGPPKPMWKIHYIFHTKYKTHEINGTGVSPLDCVLEVMRWAEEIINADEQRNRDAGGR